MDWRVVFSASSQRDLQRIVKYIARDDPAAAQRFGLRLVDVAESLIRAPRMGLELGDGSDRRIFPLSSYLIIYRVHSRRREIRVLRFWHGARRRLPRR